MIYSRTVSYTISSLIYLANLPRHEFGTAKQIAEQSDISPNVLAKLLQQLTRKGLLRSSKGAAGGYGLAEGAESISLLEMVEAAGGFEHSAACPLGITNCTDPAHRAIHSCSRELYSRTFDYLRRTSVSDLVRNSKPEHSALRSQKFRSARIHRANICG